MRLVLKPYSDKIIVRRKDPESELLYLPPGKNPPVEGTVLAFGEDTSFVKADDVVVFGQYSAHKILDGDNLWVIVEGDIIYKKEGEKICQ